MSLKKKDIPNGIKVKEAIEGLDIDSAIKVGKYMQSRNEYEKERDIPNGIKRDICKEVQISKLENVIKTWNLSKCSLAEHLYENGVRIE